MGLSNASGRPRRLGCPGKFRPDQAETAENDRGFYQRKGTAGRDQQ
jgi:hypothetical protein